ncbi:hypothetical protein ACJW30_03G040300 [Castanea mollissima]
MNLQRFFDKPDLCWLNGMGNPCTKFILLLMLGDMENVMLGAIYLASKKLRAVLMVPQLWQEFWITGDVDGRG